MVVLIAFIGIFNFISIEYCFSQQHRCSTPIVPNNEGAFTPPSGLQLNDEFHLRIYVHAVRKSGGAGGPTLSNIHTSLNYLDNLFNPYNIYFHWDGCVDNVIRQDLYDLVGSPPENILDENPNDDGIDIYIFGDDTVYPIGNAFGIGYRSGFNVGGYYDNTGTYWARSPVIAHEMGHVLNLYHTHTTHDFGNNIGGVENVTRDINDPCYNCDVAGDLLCGTPADGDIDMEVDANCVWLHTGSGHPCPCDACGVKNNPDTKNIMSYSKEMCLEHFSDDQVMRMKDAIVGLPHLSSCIIAEPDQQCGCAGDIHINNMEDITINSDMEFDGSIHVHTGGKLTITSKVEFSYDRYINVERGAKLVIDDATLTKCPNADYWKGIFVEGNANIAQPAYSAMPASDESGIVLIRNNSLIEHAQTAISTIKKGQGWNDDYWGGVVYCNEANFVNNRRGVAFMKYGYPGHYKNESAFIQCEFIIDGNYSYPYASNTHGITIWNCNDIEIKSTDFINLHTGLAGIDFSAKVISGNKFKDCRYGIKSNSSNNFASALKLGESGAIENIFEDNARSIWLRANDYLNGGEIENNEFKITSTYSFPSQKHNGLYIEGMSYFVVNENTFTDYFSPAIISHTGDDHNDFKCNSILNDKDLNAEGLVIRNKNDYLEFLSNTFTIPFECKPDVRIYGSEYEGTVKEDQGGGSRPAGNCFSKQDRLEIEAIYNTRPFDYYVKQEFVDYCVLPTDNQYDGGVNNYDLEFTRLLYPNCDAQTGPGGEITTTSTNVTLDGGGENSGDGDYDTLRYQINSEWEAGNYQNALQILLNDGSPHALRIAFGMYIKLGDYGSADSLLNVILSNNAMDDTPEFYAVQTINLRRLNAIGDTTGFELTQTEYDTLYTIAQGETYSGTYAKSLLDFLEEVIIDFIPNPDCVEEDDEGQAGLRETSDLIKLESVSIRLWPTPAKNLINYEVVNQGERTLKSVQLTSSKGQTFNMNGIGESTQIDIAKFPSGIYIFEFRFDDGTKASKRFIKL